MTLKNQVAKGLKWQAINIVGRQLLAFAVFTTLTRLLDPSAFGLVGLVTIYLGLVSMFTEQGISTALIQRQNLEKAHLDTAFWFNFSCASVLCLGTIVFAGPISLLLGNPELVAPLRWSSLVLVLSSLSTIHSAIFIKDMDFRRPTIRILISSAAGGAVGVGMALAGYGVWALILQQLTTAFAGAVFLWAVSSYRPTLSFSKSHLKDLFGVSSSTILTTLCWFVTTRVDQVVIGRFAGASVLGLYVIGGKLPDMAKTMTHEPLAGIALPALSRLQNEPAKLCQAIYEGMELNAAVSFAIFVGSACTATELIPLLFGPKWIAITGTSSLLSLLALVYVLQVFFHPALLAAGGAKRWAVLNACLTVGALTACLVGIQFGLNWLVVGLILNSLVVAIPSLIYLRTKIGLSPLRFCQSILVPAAAAAVMAGILWLVPSLLPANTPLSLILAGKIVVGAAAYLSVMFIFKRSLIDRIVHMGRRAFGLDKTPSPAVAG